MTVSAINADQPILVADGFTGGFKSHRGYVEVLHSVSFEVRRHAMTAVVGETGSGKSLSALCALGIQPSTFVRTAGRMTFDGVDIVDLKEKELRALRGRGISMVFQDARAALNPVIPIGRQLADVARLHQNVTRKQAMEQAVEALRRVRIPEPARRAKQFAHEFSGGMAQRVMIAMALLCEPKLLILDEPTTGLDLTTQAGILELIADLRAETGTTVLLITHDLGVVAATCDDVIVMNRGDVVETGTCQILFTASREAYTRRLIAASHAMEGVA